MFFKNLFFPISIAIILFLCINSLADDSEPKFSWPIEIQSDGGFIKTGQGMAAELGGEDDGKLLSFQQLSCYLPLIHIT